jgi:hypothetical protein
MDWLIVVLFSLASAVSTGLFVSHNAKQSTTHLARRRPTLSPSYAGKWRLPPAGTNLELYRKTKELLDTLESERDEARAERDSSRAEVKYLEEKLTSAQSIVQAWTHSKMEIFVKPRKREEKQKVPVGF